MSGTTRQGPSRPSLFLAYEFIALMALGLCPYAAADEARQVHFNRDIRPILSENCFFCHGPDPSRRKADLRLDSREAATADRGGYKAIEPGSLEKSELWRRITSTDPDVHMPLPASNKTLTPQQIELLKQWIVAGAPWEGHWAYEPVKAEPAPEVASPEPLTNDIDRFVYQYVQSARFQPSPPADRVTLIRRLSFDLTGLLPTREEVQSFVADESPDAYEKLVDRLLASPRYGERMAIYWLDVVRYGDSIGYHSDNSMPVAPYREYVIQAFNENMPFDQFTREQLAGDLLESPTDRQLTASAYNRLNKATEEGGAQPKEYDAIMRADRIRNVSEAWLASTMGCAQCHDHKFDPFTAKDFYSLGAFFADLDAPDIYHHDNARGADLVLLPPPEKERVAALKAELAPLDAQFEAETLELAAAQAQWEGELKARIAAGTTEEIVWFDDAPATPPTVLEGAFQAVSPEVGPVFSGVNARLQRGQENPDHALKAIGKSVAFGDRLFVYVQTVAAPLPTELTIDVIVEGQPTRHAYWAAADRTEAAEPEPWVRIAEVPSPGKWTRLEVPIDKLGLGHGQVIAELRFRTVGGNAYWDSVGLLRTHAGLSKAQVDVLQRPDAERKAEEAKDLRRAFREQTPLLAEVKTRREALKSEIGTIEESGDRVLISHSVSPRTVRILARGNWMDESGEEVQPAIPAVFGTLDAGGQRATRLDLANWIVSPSNPLTARVFVNRVWMLLFGRGISPTPGDFGAQGKFPSNPELLDYLAARFVQSGWDVKALVKHIVLSRTYQQTSRPTPEMREKDPLNDLFARQGRFRLDAEVIRDNALFVSGLLVERVGGESIFPYQPAGYWDQLNFPKRTYEEDKDGNQYRRGVYTHWQRTFPHPMLKTFDAPSREECTAQRPRSNTPLQSLVLLNDPTFVEAARVFAVRMLREGGNTPEQRIRWAYEAALSQPPDPEVESVLMGVFNGQQAHYQAAPAAADELLTVGLAPKPEGVEPVQVAAYTAVARVILNLHETITRY